MVSGVNVPVLGGGTFQTVTSVKTQVRSFHLPFNCTQFKYMSKSTEKYMTGILYYVWKGLGEFNAANLKKNRVVYRLNIKYAV